MLFLINYILTNYLELNIWFSHLSQKPLDVGDVAPNWVTNVTVSFSSLLIVTLVIYVVISISNDYILWLILYLFFNLATREKIQNLKIQGPFCYSCLLLS